MTIRLFSITDYILLLIFAIDLGAYFLESNLLTRYLPFLFGLNFLAFFMIKSIDFVYLALIISIIFLCCMFRNQDSSLNIMSILINVALGFYLYLRPPNQKAIFLFSSTFLLILLMRFYNSSSDIYQIILSGSVNYISVISISASALYYSFVPKQNKPVNLLPAIITFILCVISTGRSGIVSSFLLLLGLILYNYSFDKKSLIKNIAYLSFLIFAIFQIIENFEFLYSSDQPTSVLFRFGFDFDLDGRLLILNEYFSNFSFADFLFGRGNSYITQATGLSIHISYLQWHISLGAFAIPLYALVIFVYFKMLAINKLYFLIMTVLLLRAGTDNIMLTAGFVFGSLLIYFCCVACFPYYSRLKKQFQYIK
tara:strand:- start:18719 stop:19822 length:1104 start_codon:yes stop_codon:yes gene_type:complete